MSPATLLVFGLGYSGEAVARAALAAGHRVLATSRTPGRLSPPPGLQLLRFDEAAPALREATHLLATAAPGEDGDPVLARFAQELAAAPNLRWAGYLSTTGVYGDHDGGWVDERTPPAAPRTERARRRLAAEDAWRACAGPRLDLLRLAGIYGPGRSVLDELRAGTARRVHQPGQRFGRIHRDDIAGAVLAAMAQDRADRPRVLNGADDLPAARADVVAYGARLLGLPVPPLIPLAEALPAMSPMARSFWSDNRQVASAHTQAALRRPWQHPTYREGLRAVLAAGG